METQLECSSKTMQTQHERRTFIILPTRVKTILSPGNLEHILRGNLQRIRNVNVVPSCSIPTSVVLMGRSQTGESWLAPQPIGLPGM